VPSTNIYNLELDHSAWYTSQANICLDMKFPRFFMGHFEILFPKFNDRIGFNFMWKLIVDDPSMVSWSVSRSVCRSIDRPFLTGIFLSKKSSANVLLRIQIGAIKGVEQGRHSIPTSPWTFSRQVHLSLESL